MIKFTILGEQRPQGSKISHALYKGGEVVKKKGRAIIITRESCKYLAGWRNQCAEAALAAVCGAGPRPPLIRGPVAMTVHFIRARPKGHYRTGRYSHLLKDASPEYPIVAPDVSKLVRAVEDAIKGVIWGDDSQVVNHVASKRYGQRFETEVIISEILPAKEKT